MKRLAVTGSILLLMIISTGLLLYKDYQNFLTTPLNINEPKVFTVQHGMSFNDVNNALKSEGVLTKQKYFEILARDTNKVKKIQSGEYLLRPGLFPKDILDLFVSGKVIQYSLTLVEGWQIQEMLNAINSNDILVKTLNLQEKDKLMEQLGYTEPNPEGLFFPDTYHFPRGTTDKAFLQRAYKRLQHILNEEWQQRIENLPYKTPYDALIMASLIEKETGLTSERNKIAGVFVRRLNKNMKLQTDPSVIYAMGKQYNGNIRKKDLDIDSPHNTYRYKGLPPTPISLVGREAIHAALHPEDGKALYFVAKGDGSHYFSETLKEHNHAVAKYQLKANR